MAADLLMGAHFSIAGGLERALFTAADYGCGAVQIFTKNASTWKEKIVTADQIETFDRARHKTGIGHIFSHTAYLINLASPDKANQTRSRNALAAELERCAALGIAWAVLHPGAHMGSGAAAGMARIAAAINRVFDRCPDRRTGLLLETTAGQGTSIGHRFEQLAAIMAAVGDRQRVGVCLDTCHVFAAGYDLRDATGLDRTLTALDATVGLDRLHLIHVNDSRRELGARVDRHAHIGQGCIGMDGFTALMRDGRLERVPKILETPKGDGGRDWDRINLDLLSRLARPAP